ncbi:MAG: peptidoglycan editing factor PgeF [Xanthomonadales bacterium]|nr:peptidoglycan editing factor PgeF [Xanthomonadales bacterium]
MTELAGIELIKPDWPAPANVHAFTTTRNGGFSQGPWDSFNLGASCGDDSQHVEKNRRLLSGLLPSEPRWLRQVHGTAVVGWDRANILGIEADAIVSNQAGQVCAVLTADCLPVLFCNKAGTHIAAAHAGWRGLAAGVLEATVLAMECKPADLMAWMGPAIGPRAFEVGKDVYDAFTSLSIENSIVFKPHRDRWLADIYQLARMALTSIGITQISGGQHCTFEEKSRFFSYRRDAETGRMASVIWLE